MPAWDQAPATKTELAESSALKANLDAATGGASAQLAKLGERLDHLERAQPNVRQSSPASPKSSSGSRKNRSGGRIRRLSGDDRHHPERRTGGE